MALVRKKLVRPRGQRGAAERARRAQTIINWRLQGWPLAKIAEELPEAGFAKISESQLRRVIHAAVEAAAQRPAEELLRIEMLRLDELQSAHYAKAIKGDAAAMDRVLAIMDRRSKLLGLSSTPRALAGAESEGAKQALLEKLNAIAIRVGAGQGQER